MPAMIAMWAGAFGTDPFMTTAWDGDVATVEVVAPDGRREVVTGEVPKVDPNQLSHLDPTPASGSNAAAWNVPVQAIPAAQPSPVAQNSDPPLLSTIESAARGAIIVEVLDVSGLADWEATLETAGCESSHPAMTCTALALPGEVVVRTSVDLETLLTNSLQRVLRPAEIQECQRNETASRVVGMLFAVGGLVTMVTGQLALLTINPPAGIVVLGLVATGGVSLSAVGVSAFLLLPPAECGKVFVFPHEIRDIAPGLLGVAKTTVTLREVLPPTIDSSEVEVIIDPSPLVFGPFTGGVAQTDIPSGVFLQARGSAASVANGGEIERFCGLYRTLVNAFVTRGEQHLEESLKRDGDADKVERQAAAVFQQLFVEMNVSSPEEIAADIKTLSEEGFEDVWGKDTFVGDRLNALLAVDGFVGDACGFSLKGQN